MGTAKEKAKAVFHTVAERLRSLKWLAQDLGLEEGASADDVIDRLNELKSGTTEEETDMETKFRLHEDDIAPMMEALGLPEDANIEDVMAAIQALKDGAGDGEGMDDDDEGGAFTGKEGSDNGDGDKKDLSKPSPAFIQLQADVNSLKDENKDLKREKLVATYQQRVNTWSAVATAETLAEELADIHDTVGEEVAEKVAKQYEVANEATVAAGLTIPIGRSKPGNRSDAPIPFEEKVNKYAEDNGMTFEVALGVVSRQDSQGFGEYRRQMNAELQEEVGN